VKLEDIADLFGGLTGKSKSDFTNGNARFVTYMNVYSNIAVNTNINTFVKIRENEKQTKLEYGDILFTGSSETSDECGMSSVFAIKTDESIYLNSFCFGLRFHNKTLFDPNFCKYLFRSKKIREEIGKSASGVTRFNISKKLFGKIKIPIPPLSIQQEIAKTLDKFDALVNDLSAGLPAEISSRHQQYEYYRNKLLNFSEISE
jgi:type I restriction enzyme S subunit